MKCGLVSGATYLFAHGSSYNETGLCLSLSMFASKAHSQSISQLSLLLLHLIAVKREYIYPKSEFNYYDQIPVNPFKKNPYFPRLNSRHAGIKRASGIMTSQKTILRTCPRNLSDSHHLCIKLSAWMESRLSEI